MSAPQYEEIIIENRFLGAKPFILIELDDDGELSFTARRWPSKKYIAKVLRMFARQAKRDTP